MRFKSKLDILKNRVFLNTNLAGLIDISKNRVFLNTNLAGLIDPV